MLNENDMIIESPMKEILGTSQIPCWTLQGFKEELKPVLLKLFQKIESTTSLILWGQYYHDAKTEKRNNRKKKKL
jgi:hypothetical protein